MRMLLQAATCSWLRSSARSGWRRRSSDQRAATTDKPPFQPRTRRVDVDGMSSTPWLALPLSKPGGRNSEAPHRRAAPQPPTSAISTTRTGKLDGAARTAQPMHARSGNVTVADEGYKHKPRKREVHLLHTGGEVPHVLDSAAVEEFKKQNATGEIKVEMRLSGEITLGIGNTRGLELSCPLTLQRPPPGPDIVVFREVDCNPAKPKKIVF